MGKKTLCVNPWVCCSYLDGGWPDGLDAELRTAMTALEERAGRRLGDPGDPLLVSVRSGAAVSMPGMMDTVLNLGLNDETAAGLAAATDDRFAVDSHRRLVQSFAKVVLGLDQDLGAVVASAVDRAGVAREADLPADAMADLLTDLRRLVHEQSDKRTPSDPFQPLPATLAAPFDPRSS